MIDAESEGFAWEDFKRSKEILAAWFESPKGDAAAMMAIPPEARAKIEENKQAAGAAAANAMGAAAADEGEAEGNGEVQPAE